MIGEWGVGFEPADSGSCFVLKTGVEVLEGASEPVELVVLVFLDFYSQLMGFSSLKAISWWTESCHC